MRMLDLFCGRWGWSKAFADRGWECVGVDLVEPSEVPANCTFVMQDVLGMQRITGFDFICASPPCQQFSIHGMKHFHPNAPFPELGLKLFDHTRKLCEESGVPYVIENVRPAQLFVGNAVHHCGPFYLWGTGVPVLVNQGISKGFGDMSSAHYHLNLDKISPHIRARNVAVVPEELANCVADYAERIINDSRVDSIA